MKTNYLTLLGSSILATGLTLSAAMSAQAASFTITGELTGDTRPDNPDLLSVDVTIDVVDSVATWTVLPSTDPHSNIKMDEFYFNLSDVAASDFTVNLLNPDGWIFDSPATTVGGGNIDFQFEYAAPNGNQNQVPASGALIFETVLDNGDWTEANFTDASQSMSNDTDILPGQMGVHLQSLTVNDTTCSQGGCSDSGFAVGNYVSGSTPPNQEVPEPGTMLSLGLFALGTAATVRKKK